MFYTFLLTLLYGISLGSFFIITSMQDRERDLKKWARSLAENMAYAARPAVWAHDHLTLLNQIAGVTNDDEILYVAILDEDGFLLSSIDPTWSFTAPIHDSTSSIYNQQLVNFTKSDGEPYYAVIQPIYDTVEKLNDERMLFDQSLRPLTGSSRHFIQGKKLGTLVLGVIAENAWQDLNNWIRFSLYITLVVTLVFLALVFLTVGKVVTPIKSLVSATGRVADGDLNHRVEHDGNDELGILANSFNKMIQKLRESHHKINNYTQDLEQKINERTFKLKLSEEKYRTLFEQSGSAVALVDQKFVFSMANHQFEKLTGYTKVELEGKREFYSFLDDQDIQIIRSYVSDSFSRNTNSIPPLNCECGFIDRIGVKKNVNLTISVMLGSNSLLISMVDVTEMRELQKKLNRSEQLAAIGEIAASIAHEIRNPLGAINTSVGILQTSSHAEKEDRELMNIICEETDRLDGIINEFLSFARLRKSKFKKADINKLIVDTIRLFNNKLGDKIEKELILADDLPAISVDMDQIKQVLINLILNAAEAMPRGGKLTISTLKYEYDKLIKAIQVNIRDTGCGIEDNHIKKVFNPFFSTKEKGVGMGLSICDRIIQNHSGEIIVESSVGKGTEIILLLPVKIPQV